MSSSSSSSRSSSPAASDVSNSSANSSDARLAALEAHGAAFLSSFGLDAADLTAPKPAATPNSKKRKRLERVARERKDREALDETEQPDAEEDDLQRLLNKAEKRKAKVAPGKAALRSAPIADKGKARAVETVVFGGGYPKGREDFAAASEGMKEFMSSKVKKPNQATSSTAAVKKRTRGEGDSDTEEAGDEDKAAQANDKALSHLLSTTLFAPGTGRSVSSNRTKANLSHHDTLSQLLELGAPSGKRKGMAVGRGWGEAALKAESMAKMPSAMRAGLRQAEKQNVHKEIERAKELGTYHPSLKKHLGRRAGLDLIMGEGKEEEKERRGRDKGIKASIGKFRDGTLTLSKREIETVNSGRGGGRGGRGGRGGALSGRGRGGKRGGRR